MHFRNRHDEHNTARRRAVSFAVLIAWALLMPATLLAGPEAELSREEWKIQAASQKLEMPGYDLFLVKIQNTSDKDRSILGVIHLSHKESDKPESASKCQYFASVPAGKSVSLRVPCAWNLDATSIRLEIEKTYPFLLDDEPQ